MIELSEKEYTIGEAAAILNEEIHNLRYWQSQLDLSDRRNEMNQRIYTQTDINTFRFVKELRSNENLSLKAIKKILHKAEIVKEEVAASSEAVIPVNNNYAAAISKLREDLFGEISKAVERGNQGLREEIEDLKEKMDYMEQVRNRKLDEAIFEWREKNRKKGFIERMLGK